MNYRLLIASTIATILMCCSAPDNRLSHIEELSCTSPQEALDSMRAINPEMLSDDDKQYYDFLTVKTADKAFINHTSDSLILRVIDNEKSHTSRGRYPKRSIMADVSTMIWETILQL